MKRVILLISLLIVFVLSGCVNTEETQEGAEVFRIGILPDDSSIPLVIADDQGFFEEEGIEVELMLFRSAVDRDSALQANELDGVSTDVLSLGLFKESDIPAYAISQTDGTYHLLVNPNSGVTEIEGLRGKSIGLSLNTLMEYLLDTAMRHNNIDASDVNKVSIPSMPARLEMLNNGQIDGATLPEPLASGAVANGSELLMSNNEFDTYPGILMVSKKYLDNNTDVFKSFSNAYNKAVEYINSTSQETYFNVVKEKLAFPEGSENYYKVKQYKPLMLPLEKEVEKGMKWLYEKELISEEYAYDDLVVNVIE